MSVKVYDNGGKTFDRYTVIIDGEDCYTMSDNALSPQGFNQYMGTDKTYADMEHGKLVKFDVLPEAVQKAIKQRLEV